MKNSGVWRWVAALGLFAALIGLWLLRIAHPATAPLAVPRRVHVPQIGEGMARSSEHSPAKPAAPKLATPTTTLEICGFGRVPIDTSDPFAAGRFLAGHTDKAGRRWLNALLNSDDVRARGTGLFLESKLMRIHANEQGSDPVQPLEDQSRDALVQLAIGANDPAVYAMAFYACNADTQPVPSGSCQQISLDRWAALDADNAVPWLLAARQARARNDATTEAAAFSRAANAHKTDGYNFSLYAFAEPELPSDATPLDRAYLAVELIGIESAVGSLQYHSASLHCSDAAMQDDGVRQQCAAVAELFVSKGTNLLDLGFGARLGARAGWPKARVASLMDERDALMQVIEQVGPGNSDDQWTCDDVSRGNAYMNQWARWGELGAARDALEWSGETVADLAQKQRDFIDKMRRDAQREQEAAVQPESAP